ncbi:hypothetical protein NQ315_012049 [Exocentrus adspersus]|uniref:DUF4371 domain-containing protein n=1 Tax=Exocentrus adspersus TaxID=1586481 RepID=A0AAV8VIP3_9CUCU|nr:hypothetical protein NQ315_012049 [Exocentrus adspersus]
MQSSQSTSSSDEGPEEAISASDQLPNRLDVRHQQKNTNISELIGKINLIGFSLPLNLKKHVARSAMKTDVATHSRAYLLDSQVAAAKIRIAGFLAEHNISFLSSDYLVPLIKDIVPDSEVVKGMELKRTKVTSICNNVFGELHKEELAEILEKKNKFSLLIDEATDILTTKSLCIVVRFFSPQEAKIVSKFWDLRLVSQDNPTTIDISKPSTSKSHEVNVYAATAERCNTMMGAHTSVSARIKQDFPEAIIPKCICHSLHLVASEACKKLPRRCEDLARDIHNFFKSSDKRRTEYLEFQAFCKVEPHRILRPSQTRWLSLLDVVKKINQTDLAQNSILYTEGLKCTI